MKLKDWLNDNEITQREMAEDFGVSKSTVSKWCSGARTPPIKRARDIKEYTGGEVSLEDFCAES